MADLQSGVRCAVCGTKNNIKRCGFCKQTYYCSREHQMKDWGQHKPICMLHRNGKAPENCGNGLNESQNQSTETTKNSSNGSHVGITRVQDAQTSKQAVKDDTIPFDKRPIINKDFLKLKPRATENDIAKLAVQNLIAQGVCVIDGVFSQSQISNALKEINQCLEENKFDIGRLEGGRTSGEVEKQVVNSNIRCDKIMWLEGSEAHLPSITSVVSRMDSILTEFNHFLTNRYFINGRTKAMIACYPGNGAYYRRHVDNPSGDGRVVTCILYLNEGWNVQKDGGLLRIFPVNTDDYVDIAPVANRLLFFWSDRRNPHEVQPAFKTRYAVTVWYMDKTERERAKQALVQEKIDTIHGEYALKEQDHYKQERDSVCQTIEATATDAVTSLTDEELMALSTLIEGQSDPDATLASMGISPNIREKLLQKLNEL